MTTHPPSIYLSTLREIPQISHRRPLRLQDGLITFCWSEVSPDRHTTVVTGRHNVRPPVTAVPWCDTGHS